MNAERFLKIFKGLILASGLLGVGALVIINPATFHLCKNFDYQCLSKFREYDGLALIGLILAVFLVVSLIVFRARIQNKSAYEAWKKFSLWWVPLSILLIFITPAQGGGRMGLDIAPDRELVLWFTTGIYFIWSILVIWWNKGFEKM